jgi:hypothetical protein
VTYIEERVYFPTGADPDDWNDRNFAIGVYWRGRGKWMVANGRQGSMQMTHTGRWLWMPRQLVAMRWCRFDFGTACYLAEKYLNYYRVNGRTWVEYDAWRAQPSDRISPDAARSIP